MMSQPIGLVKRKMEFVRAASGEATRGSCTLGSSNHLDLGLVEIRVACRPRTTPGATTIVSGSPRLALLSAAALSPVMKPQDQHIRCQDPMEENGDRAPRPASRRIKRHAHDIAN